MACTMSTFMCKINVIGLMFRHSKFFLSSFLAIALMRTSHQTIVFTDVHGRPRMFFLRQRCDFLIKSWTPGRGFCGYVGTKGSYDFLRLRNRDVTGASRFTSRFPTDPRDCVPVACGFLPEPYGGNTVALRISPIPQRSTDWYGFVADIHGGDIVPLRLLGVPYRFK